MKTPQAANAILATVFLLMMFGVGPFDAFHYLRGSQLPGQRPHRKVGDLNFPEGLWSGSLTTRVERKLMNTSMFARSLIGPYNEAVYDLFGRAPPAVREGRNRWLSTADRPREIPTPRLDGLVEENVAAISAVHRRLQERNAVLIVGLIPDRGRLHPDRAYVNGEMPPNKKGYLPLLTQRLKEAGVPTINLTDGLRAVEKSGHATTYTDDHHWTSRAAREAARRLASATPLITTGKGELQYRMKWIEKEKSDSSLLRSFSLPEGSDTKAQFFDYADRVHPSRLRTRSRSPCAAYWTTSFGRYGSGEFFANEVRCPVDILKGVGKGSSYGPMHGLDRVPRRADDETPFVVVWEIPEYHTISRTDKKPSYIRKVEDFLAGRPASNDDGSDE